MAKANLQLRQKHNDGDYHEIEIFFVRGGIIIHRHVLTENEERATIWNKHRKFWNKWYTMQEVAIMKNELKDLIWGMIKHPFRTYRLIKQLK